MLNDTLEQGYITQAEYDEAQADTEDLYDRIQTANLEVGGDSSVDSLLRGRRQRSRYGRPDRRRRFGDAGIRHGLFRRLKHLFSRWIPIFRRSAIRSFPMKEPVSGRDPLVVKLPADLPRSQFRGGRRHRQRQLRCTKNIIRKTAAKTSTCFYDSQEEAYSAIESYRRNPSRRGGGNRANPFP